MAINSPELFAYRKNGLSLLMPKFLRVKSDAPSLFAAANANRTGLIVSVNPAPEQRKRAEEFLNPHAAERAVSELLGIPISKSTTLETRFVRDGKIHHPYKGFEYLFEERDLESNNIHFDWRVNFYPTKYTFVEANVYSFCKFEDEELLWTKVIDSICVDFTNTALNVVPRPSKKVIVGTENNMFVIGPKKLVMSGIPFSDKRELQQGFAATPHYVFVTLPNNSLECEVCVEFTKSIPDLKQAAQAFSVPIAFGAKDEPYTHAVSGSVLPIAVPPGKYDMVVRLFEGKKKDDKDTPDWRAVLTFLPAGTVGAKVFKLKDQPIPKEIYIRGK